MFRTMQLINIYLLLAVIQLSLALIYVEASKTVTDCRREEFFQEKLHITAELIKPNTTENPMRSSMHTNCKQIGATVKAFGEVINEPEIHSTQYDTPSDTFELSASIKRCEFNHIIGISHKFGPDVELCSRCTDTQRVEAKVIQIVPENVNNSTYRQPQSDLILNTKITEKLSNGRHATDKSAADVFASVIMLMITSYILKC